MILEVKKHQVKPGVTALQMKGAFIPVRTAGVWSTRWMS